MSHNGKAAAEEKRGAAQALPFLEQMLTDYVGGNPHQFSPEFMLEVKRAYRDMCALCEIKPKEF